MAKNRQDNLSIRKRFAIMFIAFILIPVLILNLSLALLQYNNNTQEYINNNKYELSNLSDTLSSELSFAFKYASVVYSDYDINTFLNKRFENSTDFYEKYQSYNLIKTLDFYANQSENIKKPVIYSNNPTIYGSTEVLSGITKDVIEANWYVAFMESGMDSFVYFDQDTRYAYIIRLLDFNGMASYTNILKIEVDLDYISINLLESEIPCKAFLFGDSSYPIYTWECGYTPHADDLSFGLLTTDTADKDVSLVFTFNVDFYGTLKFIIVIAQKSFLSLDLIISTLVPLAFTLIASMLFMNSMQKNYIARIENLVTSVSIDEFIKSQNNEQSDDENDAKSKKKSQSNNELTIVQETIEKMSTRIHDLIKESYELEMEKNQAEIKRKQSELNSLLAQINPHYLFNVLNAIRLKSLIKGEKETAKIILYISKIMRQSITWNNDVVSLNEELDFIKDYLAIEKYRFEDKLEYEINIIDEELLGCEIPKLCLQPFIENACVHGVQSVIGNGKITITVRNAENDRYEFTITNPTSSFPEETKEMILGYAKGNFDVDTKSVGLKNTFARLRIYYDDFDFKLLTEGEFVTFSLFLPKTVTHKKEKEI